MTSKSILKNYGLLIAMFVAIVGGCIVGAVWPGATVLAPFGQIFMNLMFCIVVPLVFTAIANSVAGMESRKRAGKLLVFSYMTFVICSAIAAIIYYLVLQIFPPVLSPWSAVEAGTVDAQTSVADLIVKFFTVGDFVELLSRKAILPLIVFSLLFGFGVNLSGGRQSPAGQLLDNLSNVMMHIVKIVTYYAPIAFFGFFANLIATYGAQVTADYARGMASYYSLSFIYLVTIFALYAFLGGGTFGIKSYFRHFARPTVTALGTCSSVATIPTNIAASKESGIPRDISDVVLPMGATMHMEGSAFSSVLKIIFISGVLGIPLEGPMSFVKIIVASVLVASCVPGIPGGGYVGEFIVCSLFFPQHMELAYPIAIAIGNLVDPPCTMINAVGSFSVSFIIARIMEGKDWVKKVLAEKQEKVLTE